MMKTQKTELIRRTIERVGLLPLTGECANMPDVVLAAALVKVAAETEQHEREHGDTNLCPDALAASLRGHITARVGAELRCQYEDTAEAGRCHPYAPSSGASNDDFAWLDRNELSIEDATDKLKALVQAVMPGARVAIAEYGGPGAIITRFHVLLGMWHVYFAKSSGQWRAEAVSQELTLAVAFGGPGRPRYEVAGQFGDALTALASCIGARSGEVPKPGATLRVACVYT